jgi:hypothetical protein
MEILPPFFLLWLASFSALQIPCFVFYLLLNVAQSKLT